MAAAKTATGSGKRNSRNRHRYVLINGEKKLVTPAWYHGSREGHGNYMAGHVDGNTVDDSNGRPIPFKQLGELE